MPRKNAHFWNLIAKKYARDPVANPDAYQKKLDMTRQYMQPEMKVAELGCGTGTTAIYHAPAVKHIIASDISKNMLDIARQKAAKDNISNVDFIRHSIEDFPFEPGEFDMVMAHSILHLLESKERAIAQVYKMLKPGGVFVSSTTCIADQWIPKLILPVGNFLGLLPLVRFFTADEMINAITTAGFEIVENWRAGEEGALFIVAKKPA